MAITIKGIVRTEGMLLSLYAALAHMAPVHSGTLLCACILFPSPTSHWFSRYSEDAVSSPMQPFSPAQDPGISVVTGVKDTG